MKISTKEDLAQWLNRALASDVSEVRVYRVARGGKDMVGAVEVDARPAIEIAAELWDLAETDSKIAGGTVRYTLDAMASGGGVIGSPAIVQFSGEQTSQDAGFRALADMILRLEQANRGVFDRLDRMLDRSMKHEDELHSQVIASMKAQEKALSKSHKREMKAWRQKAQEERKDKMIEAVLQVAGPVLASKLNLPPEVIAQMMGGGKSGAAEKKLALALQLLQLIPSDKLDAALASTGPEGQEIFVKLMTPEE